LFCCSPCGGDLIFGRRRAYQRKLAVAEMDGICSAHAMQTARIQIVQPDVDFVGSITGLDALVDAVRERAERKTLPPLPIEQRQPRPVGVYTQHGFMRLVHRAAGPLFVRSALFMVVFIGPGMIVVIMIIVIGIIMTMIPHQH